MSSLWTFMPGFSGKKGFIYTRKQGMMIALLTCVFVSACGMLPGNDTPSPSAQPSENSGENPGAAPAPGASAPGVIAPLTGPPVIGDRPPLPGETGRPRDAQGLPVMAARGVNYEKLFAEEISDPDARIQRVENAVIELRRDFESVLPSILRLVAVEKDIRDLTSQLEILLQNEPPSNYPAADNGAQPFPAEPADMPPAVEGAASLVPALPPSPDENPVGAQGASPLPEPPAAGYEEVANAQAQPQAPPPPEAAAAFPVASPGQPQILGLRLGMNGANTRLVFDATASLSFRQDLDNAENLLVIEIAEGAWTGPSAGTGSAGSLVQSWSAQPLESGAGARLIVVLRGGARLAGAFPLNPGGDSPHHRIVLDLQPAP